MQTNNALPRGVRPSSNHAVRLNEPVTDGEFLASVVKGVSVSTGSPEFYGKPQGRLCE
jgi:hypothetical protein